MPQSEQSKSRKREYNRERNRRLRGQPLPLHPLSMGGRGDRGMGKGGTGGVVTNVVISPRDWTPFLWVWNRSLVEQNELLGMETARQGKQIREALARITQLEADQTLREAQEVCDVSTLCHRETDTW